MKQETAQNALEEIQQRMESLVRLFEFFKDDDRLEDYSMPVLQTSSLTEQVLWLLFLEKGYQSEHGLLTAEPNGMPIPKFDGIPFSYFNRNWQKIGVPSQIFRFVSTIRQYRNLSAHGGTVSYGECVIVAEAFCWFVTWFAFYSKTLNQEKESARDAFLQRIDKVKNRFVTWTMIDSASQKPILSGSDLPTPAPETLQQKERADELVQKALEPILESIHDVQAGISRIEKHVDQMAEQLSRIYENMVNYQALLERQIQIAVSDSEVDRIIKAYSDEVSARITREVGGQLAGQAFEEESARLHDSLGQTAWDRLDETSREFLVTAKLTYQNYSRISGAVDYSGVCLLVTKAIEVEMNNRFCRDYLAFLKEKYPGKANLAQYPASMLNRYGKAIKPKDFTLGNLAYVLGMLRDESWSEEVAEQNAERILEYAREKIMVGRSEDEIEEALEQIADGIETVRKDYRNPSAHTNQLQKINAKECFDLVLDVEKLLKSILELLDY